MGASEEGAPFNCDEWQNNKNLSGGRLVGALTFLNVPSIPFRGDTILTFRFQADTEACVAATCPQPCTDDTQCSDGDPCNGREFCYLNTCQPGVPVTCDDGNQCNGREACNQNSGLCDASNGVACDDDNPCTTGTCRPDFLCTYTNEPDDKPCDDGGLCTGPDPVTGGVCATNNCDRCANGVCTGPPTNQTPGQPGPAAECENNNRCDGIMACDPATGTLHPDGAAAHLRRGHQSVHGRRVDPVLGCNPPNTRVTTGASVPRTPATGSGSASATSCLQPRRATGRRNVCDGFSSATRCPAPATTPLDCRTATPARTTAASRRRRPRRLRASTPPTATCNDQSACTENDAQRRALLGTLSAAAATCNSRRRQRL